MIDRLKNLLKRLEVNRAVGFLVLTRGWQFISLIGSSWLVSHFLSRQQQDLYQVFPSLLAMQTLVELGLPTITALLTSHEWAKLRLNDAGQIEGDSVALVRLANLDRVMGQWFRIGSIIFFFVVLVRGFLVVNGNDPKWQNVTSTDWLLPWLAVVIVSVLDIPFVIRTAILEGCQQVATINRLRLGQALTGTLAVWGVLLAGGGLYALVASAIVRYGWDFYIVRVRYGELFRSLRTHAFGETHILREEIWPLGWRIALQTIGSYFANPYLIQVIYLIQRYGLSPEGTAGRFGYTTQVLAAIQGVSLAWVNTRSPEYTLLAAQWRHAEMRQRMWKSGWISFGVYWCGVASFLICLYVLRAFGIRAADLFMPISYAAELAVGYAAMLITNLLHYSIRYDKRDPFVIPTTISNMATPLLAWWLGLRLGAEGVIWAFVTVAGLYSLPMAIGLAVAHARRISAELATRSDLSAE